MKSILALAFILFVQVSFGQLVYLDKKAPIEDRIADLVKQMNLDESGYVADGDTFVYLNKVRKRALLSDKTSATVANQAAFHFAFEQERRVEFAFEGQRWFDLVCTGRAIPLLNANSNLIGIKKSLTEDNLIFPIPQSQVDINKDKITQNKVC